jgi:hypothetical protein
MTTPLAIFAGLFVAASTLAICGTLEARSPALNVKSPATIHQENVVVPADLNLVSSCHDKAAPSGAAVMQQQCKTQLTVHASK